MGYNPPPKSPRPLPRGKGSKEKCEWCGRFKDLAMACNGCGGFNLNKHIKKRVKLKPSYVPSAIDIRKSVELNDLKEKHIDAIHNKFVEAHVNTKKISISTIDKIGIFTIIAVPLIVSTMSFCRWYDDPNWLTPKPKKCEETAKPSFNRSTILHSPINSRMVFDEDIGSYIPIHEKTFIRTESGDTFMLYAGDEKAHELKELHEQQDQIEALHSHRPWETEKDKEWKEK